ncbi:hypothetical protein WMF31_37745 [Sorangium sp. So ce1036]
MAGPALELERVVPAYGHPGDARRAQVVERDLLPRSVVREEVGPRNAGTLEVLAEAPGEVRHLRHVLDDAPLPARFGVHHPQEREQLRLDREPARLARLRRLLLVAVAVDPPVNVNRAAIEVDVLPHQSFQLARSWKQIRGEDVNASPVQRHALARREPEELVRVEVRLGFLDPPVGATHPGGRVVVAYAERPLLRVRGVVEHLRDERPHEPRSVPRELALPHAEVELLDELLDGLTRDLRHLEIAERWQDVGPEARTVGADRGEALRFARGDPPLGPLAHRLARGLLVDRLRLLALGNVHAVRVPGAF